MCFRGIIHTSLELLSAAFEHQLIISDFLSFRDDMQGTYPYPSGSAKSAGRRLDYGNKVRILISQKELYDECARIESGKITNYTDYLHKTDDQFAVSICSIDGQKMGLGPHNKMFTMQSLIVRCPTTF